MANSRSNNVGWRIDYFFGTKEILPMVNNCWLEPTIYGSDHCPVVIELRF
jgi:exodeoxyribonuclease-3